MITKTKNNSKSKYSIKKNTRKGVRKYRRTQKGGTKGGTKGATKPPVSNPGSNPGKQKKTSKWGQIKAAVSSFTFGKSKELGKQPSVTKAISVEQPAAPMRRSPSVSSLTETGLQRARPSSISSISSQAENSQRLLRPRADSISSLNEEMKNMAPAANITLPFQKYLAKRASYSPQVFRTGNVPIAPPEGVRVEYIPILPATNELRNKLDAELREQQQALRRRQAERKENNNKGYDFQTNLFTSNPSNPQNLKKGLGYTIKPTHPQKSDATEFIFGFPNNPYLNISTPMPTKPFPNRETLPRANQPLNELQGMIRGLEERKNIAAARKKAVNANLKQTIRLNTEETQQPSDVKLGIFGQAAQKALQQNINAKNAVARQILAERMSAFQEKKMATKNGNKK